MDLTRRPDVASGNWFTRTVDSWPFLLATMALVPVERVLTREFHGSTIRPVYLFMVLVIVRGLFPLWRMWPTSPLLRRWTLANAVGLVVVVGLHLFAWPVSTTGYVAWAALDIVFMAAALGAIVEHPPLLVRWTDAYTLAAVAWSVFGVVQFALAFHYRHWAYGFVKGIPRVHGWSYEPSFYALFLMPAAAILLTRRRWWQLAVVMAGLVVSTSRTGFFGLAVALCFTGLVMDAEVRRSVWRVVKWSALCLVLALPLLRLFPPSRRYLHFFRSAASVTAQTSGNDRLRSWVEGFWLMGHRPVVGWGIGGTGGAEHSLGRGLRVPVEYLKVNNLFAEVAAELGVLGLLALLAWLVIPIVGLRAHTRDRRTAGIFLATISMVAATPFFQTWWRPNVWFVYVLAVGAWLLGSRRDADVAAETS